jgi:hypothetical protein
MEIAPCTLKQANEYILWLHRHHKPVTGHRFSLCAHVDGNLVGVVTVGRPVARMSDQNTIAEVTRLCTNGYKNACSKLYGAAARVCKEMGFASIQTFILESESGKSLIASGWVKDSVTSGGSWSRPSRGRIDKAPIVKKIKFIKELR